MAADDAPTSFSCPRCGEATEAAFYGPCPVCRAQLIATQLGAGREVEAARFEPALRVVPNQVATKE